MKEEELRRKLVSWDRDVWTEVRIFGVGGGRWTSGGDEDEMLLLVTEFGEREKGKKFWDGEIWFALVC